jgi:hypothetical protein
MANDMIKATKEMRKFRAEVARKTSEYYAKQNELEAESRKLKEDISVATIGFGKAIVIMTERLDLAEKGLKKMKIELPNSGGEFVEKFGVDMYKVDFTGK